MKQNFIKTSDKETREKLLKLGYVEIKENGGFYTFINDTTKMNFGEVDKNKICFSNILVV